MPIGLGGAIKKLKTEGELFLRAVRVGAGAYREGRKAQSCKIPQHLNLEEIPIGETKVEGDLTRPAPQVSG